MSLSELYRHFKRKAVDIERATENEDRLPTEAELAGLMASIAAMQKFYPGHSTPGVGATVSNAKEAPAPISTGTAKGGVDFSVVKISESARRRGSHLPRKDDNYIWNTYTTCNSRYAYTDKLFAVPRGTIGIMAKKLNWTPQKVMGRIQVLKGLRAPGATQQHAYNSDDFAEDSDDEDGSLYSVDSENENENETDDSSTFKFNPADAEPGDSTSASKKVKTESSTPSNSTSSTAELTFTPDEDKMILEAYNAAHTEDSPRPDSPSSKKRKALAVLANSDVIDNLASRLRKPVSSISARLTTLLNKQTVAQSSVEPPMLSSHTTLQRRFTRQEDLFIWNSYVSSTLSDVNTTDLSFNAPRGRVKDIAEEMDITIPQLLTRFRELKTQQVLDNANASSSSSSSSSQKLSNNTAFHDPLPQHKLLPLDFLSKLKQSQSQSQNQSKSQSSTSEQSGLSGKVKDAAPVKYSSTYRGSREPPHNFTAEEDQYIWNAYVSNTNSDVGSADLSFNAPSGTVSQLAEDLQVSTQQVLGRFKQLKSRQVQELIQRRKSVPTGTSLEDTNGESKLPEAVTPTIDAAVDKEFRASLAFLPRSVIASRGGYNPPFTVEQDVYLWDAYLASTLSPVDNSNMGFNAPRGRVNVIARDLSIDIPQLMNRFRFLKAHYLKLLNGAEVTESTISQQPGEQSGGRNLRPKGWQPHRQVVYNNEPTDAPSVETPEDAQAAAALFEQLSTFTAEEDALIWTTYVTHTRSIAASKDMRFNAPEGTVGKLAESMGRMGGSGIQIVLNRFRDIKKKRLELGLDPAQPLPSAASASTSSSETASDAPEMEVSSIGNKTNDGTSKTVSTSEKSVVTPTASPTDLENVQTTVETEQN
eukprot:gene8310-9882_t